MFTVGNSDKFLETDYVRIFLVDKIYNFGPGRGILVPLIIIKQSHVISKEAYFFFMDCRFLTPGLKLEVFSENIPSSENWEKGYQDVPFSENQPEHNKKQIDYEDERIAHPYECEYPGGSRTDMYRQICGDQWERSQDIGNQ